MAFGALLKPKNFPSLGPPYLVAEKWAPQKKWVSSHRPTGANVQLQQGWEIPKAEGPVRFGKVCCWVVGGVRQIHGFPIFPEPKRLTISGFQGDFCGPGINPQHMKESGALQPRKDGKCHLDNP